IERVQAHGGWRRRRKSLEPAARQPSERALRRAQHLGRTDGPHDDQHERLGNVGPPVESDKRFAREPLDDLRGADHWAAVGVPVEEERIEPPEEMAMRVVLTPSHLLEDDALLEVERLLSER